MSFYYDENETWKWNMQDKNNFNLQVLYFLQNFCKEKHICCELKIPKCKTSEERSISGNTCYILLAPYKMIIWNKVFKNGPSKICGRQHLKKLKLCGLFKQKLFKAVFHIFYLHTLSNLTHEFQTLPNL